MTAAQDHTDGPARPLEPERVLVLRGSGVWLRLQPDPMESLAAVGLGLRFLLEIPNERLRRRLELVSCVL